ncbi:MAG: M1 family metallopeptidase [Deltaproteobacteria bacterium]|nr:M1 family metallopeptidase [Deltaproteobacteria bacterium]
MWSGVLLLLLADPLSGPALVEALTAGGSSNPRPVANYQLEVRYDPQTHRLKGQGRVQFTNSTEVNTEELRWHLYLNAFLNDRSTFMKSSGGQLRGDQFEEGQYGFITVTRMVAASRAPGEPPAELLSGAHYAHPDDDNDRDRTVWVTPLPYVLGPGQTITLELEFTAQLPKVFARSGYSGDFAMVAQWFPKLGVLQASGWNCHQYHGLGEFYADYGDYRVAITVPADHVVGATGSLLETQTGADGWVTSIYAEKWIHDFAFAVDPRFLEAKRTFRAEVARQDPDTAAVAHHLGLKPEQLELSDVEIRLLYQPEHAAHVERYLDAMEFGLGWYGRRYGAYPYPNLTVIDGPRGAGGAMGMEYPTFIAGGVGWPSPESGPSPEQVALHELAHQWWYGLVGNNEVEEAWLDEGFTTYSAGSAMDEKYGPKIFGPFWLHPWLSGRRLHQKELWRLGTLLAPERDAIVRPVFAYRNDASYGMNVYPRAALTLQALGRTIGEDRLAQVLRLYQRRWRYRHPTTQDFQAVVEEITGQPQGEFFAAFIHDSAALDYGITELSSEADTPPQGYADPDPTQLGALPAPLPTTTSTPAGFLTKVVVERLRETVRPVVVLLHFEDGSQERWTWDGRYRWGRYEVVTKAQLRSAQLDPEGIELLDLSRINNGRLREKDHRPAAFFGASVLAVVQSAWQILGAFW